MDNLEVCLHTLTEYLLKKGYSYRATSTYNRIAIANPYKSIRFDTSRTEKGDIVLLSKGVLDHPFRLAFYIRHKTIDIPESNIIWLYKELIRNG